MKKILLIIASIFQFANAQTKPATGEYLSEDKSNSGINLFLHEDKTFQMFVLNGTYEIKNDSIIFDNNPTDKSRNSFDVQFTKSKSANKNVTFFIVPTYMYESQTYFIGIQNKADGEIIYKSVNEYLDETEVGEYFEKSYSERNVETTIMLPFELDKPYAIYLVKNSKEKAKIEKYIIPSDVSEVKIKINSSMFDDFNMSGTIQDNNTLKVFVNKTSPLKFVNKNSKSTTSTEKPALKTVEKNWTFPGKKEHNDYLVDSATVVVDSAMAYTDYANENNFEFKAKLEKNFKEALVNIKKDTLQKYLFVYYNLKDKKAEKNFNEFIDEYNNAISDNMYSEYDASYDNFNFYFATKNEESFFKKNNIKDKSFVILNKDGKIIASSDKKIGDISYKLNYDTSYITEKLRETENSIQLASSIANKKTSIPELTKKLNTNYKDFYVNRYDYTYQVIDTAVAVVDYQTENEVIETAAIAVDTAAFSYNNDFTYYKSEVSKKLLTEKLNTIFDYYNSKNIVNDDLVNILLGEISGNHTSFDLFKNENNTNNKQEIKYINYILKYNQEEDIKNKIARIINDIIINKTENPETATYNAIAYNLITYSGNDLNILSSVINLYNQKEKASEEANKIVDLYYNTLVNDKPLFENIDSQYTKSNTSAEYKTDWINFKSQINSLLNAQAWDIFEMNQTKDFERAIRWSELSNIVEKENPYSLDTLGQLYFAVGRKSEAIVIQTKAVARAKEMQINHEEFEKALNNMKK